MLSSPVRHLFRGDIVVSFRSKELLCINFISSWSALKVKVTYREIEVSTNDQHAL
jgi:hypothetical protein